jgi:hypothetical protein
MKEIRGQKSEVRRPKQDRFYVMNDDTLVYITSGRTNMMVTECKVGKRPYSFANYNIYYKDEIFVECGTDLHYPFLKKFLCVKDCKIIRSQN